MSQTGRRGQPVQRFTLADLVGRQTLKWQAYPPEVLPLWVAEMDTDLAEPVRDAIITAVRRGEVGYPWGRAYPEALASFAPDAWGWSLDPDTVRHTADVMTGMAHAVRLVTPPDGVLVLTTPVYPPFLDLPEITGRQVRHVGLTAPDDSTSTPWRPPSPRSAPRVGRPPWRCATPTTRPVWPTPATSSNGSPGSPRSSGCGSSSTRSTRPLVHPGATFTPYLTVAGAERAYAVHSASKAFNLPGLRPP